MLCQKCNKNQANVHLVKMINGEKNSVWICEGCAKKISDISVSVASNMSEKSIQNLLGGFFEELEKNREPKMDVICKNCGLTYSEFEKKNQAGCGKCYDSFKDSLDEKVIKVKKGTFHIGKVPNKGYKKVIDQTTILELKEQLRKVISKEEYEKAAIIRDKIRFLEGSKESREIIYEKLD